MSLYLSTLKIKFGVIAVTETWASADNEALLSISGYNSVFKNRLKNRGGGVALFISNTINFTEREDLNAFSCNDFESVFIELNDLHEGTKIIGAIYRPPGHDTTNFLTCFNSVCNIISKGTKTMHPGWSL